MLDVICVGLIWVKFKYSDSHCVITFRQTSSIFKGWYSLLLIIIGGRKSTATPISFTCIVSTGVEHTNVRTTQDIGKQLSVILIDLSRVHKWQEWSNPMPSDICGLQAGMASVLMLSYLIKVKLRRKWTNHVMIVFLVLSQLFVSLLSHSISPTSSSTCGDVLCFHGTCQDGRSVCENGWQVSACHRCGGRIRYYSCLSYFDIDSHLLLRRLDSTSGYIRDATVNYITDLQWT